MIEALFIILIIGAAGAFSAAVCEVIEKQAAKSARKIIRKQRRIAAAKDYAAVRRFHKELILMQASGKLPISVKEDFEK